MASTWNRRSGIMLCYPMEEKRLQKWAVPGVMVQPKFDGVRCRALVENGQVYLLSSEENPILSVPHIIEELQAVLSPSTKVELDGELYIHGLDFSEIRSRVSRTVKLHPKYHEVEYHIFDLISSETQMERFSALFDLLSKRQTEKIRLVRTEIATGMEEIDEYLEQFLDQGYEGIIVRHPYAQYVRKHSTSVMKFKPKKQDIYQISEAIEAIDQYGNPKGELGALWCFGSDLTRFKVGCGRGINRQDKIELWENRDALEGLFVRVSYQNLTPNKVPRFGKFVEIIWRTDLW